MIEKPSGITIAAAAAIVGTILAVVAIALAL